MAVPDFHYGAQAPTSYHLHEGLEPYFGVACCPYHCLYRNLNHDSLDARSLQFGLSDANVQSSDLEGLGDILTPVFNAGLSNTASYATTDLSSDPAFSNQPSPSGLLQVESQFNLPYLAVGGYNSVPSSDATLEITSWPFDLPLDPSVANFFDETFGTPSSTATEGLGIHFCDVCFKLLRASDYRRHMRTHVKPYHCSMADCLVAFSEKKDLRRHEATKHGIGAVTFYCQVVGCKWHFKGFSRRDTLGRHMKKVHHTLG